MHSWCSDKYLAETIICFNIGIAHYLRMTEDDDEEEASLWFQRALVTSSLQNEQDDNSHNHSLYYIIAHNVGYTYWHMGRYEDASSTYPLALEYLTSIIKVRRSKAQTDHEQDHGDKRQVLFAMSTTLNCIATSRLHTKAHEANVISHQKTLQTIGRALAVTQQLTSGTDCINELLKISSSGASKLITTANTNVHTDISKLKVEEAKNQFEVTLHGNTHTTASASLFHIAEVQGELGNTEEAITAYESFITFATSEDNQETENEKIAIALTTMGQLCCKIDDYDRAMEYLPRAVEASHSAFGRNHEATAFALNQVGTALYGLGKCDAALSAFKTGLEIELNLPNVPKEDIIATMSNIAAIQGLSGYDTEALYHYNKALKLIREHPGTNNLDVKVGILTGKSSVHEKLGEFAPAEVCLKDALDVMKDLCSDSTYEFSVILNSLGLVRFKKEDYIGALGSFQASLKIRNSTENELSASSIALLYNNIAATYRKLGNPGKALAFYKKTLQIDIDCGDDCHPQDILSSMTHIAAVYKEKGFYTQALKHYTEAEKYSIQNRAKLNFDDVYNVIMGRHSMSAFLDHTDKEQVVLISSPPAA
jgi:tetratricopeptide (TPR) repeat protein